MSDFPNALSFSTSISEARIRSLKNCLPVAGIPVVVKREKDQYIYDIDGNKYADFSLYNGAVIYGHNFKTLTRYIKNGISTGTSSGLIDKFRYPLVRLFKSVIDFGYISFYGSTVSAIVSLVKSLGAGSIGVSSSYLLDLAFNALPGISVEMAAAGKHYDLFLFEPLDFDLDLKEYGHENFKAVWKCSVETRTAFRLQRCFSNNLDKVPFILCGPSIANGLDCAVIFSKRGIEGENIPAFKSVAVLETMKVYLRNNDLYKKKISIGSAAVSCQKGSIFKIKNSIEPAGLLKYGVMMESGTGFLCMMHTENDIKRLERALEGKDFAAETRLYGYPRCT